MDWKFFARTHKHDGNDGSSRLVNPRFGENDTNCLEVLPTGQAIQRGDSSMWEDINTPFAAGKTPPSNFPDWVVISSPFYGYRFKLNDGIQAGSTEMPHSWDEGTPVEVHLHLISNGTDTSVRTIGHQVKIVWANPNTAGDDQSVFFTTDKMITLTAQTVIPANTAANTHFVTSLGYISIPNGKIGLYMTAYYTRVSGGGTEPTNNPFIIAIGYHYRRNSLGSLTTYGKGL